MCGIVGFCGKEFSKKDITLGLKKIKYRGPDETFLIQLKKEAFFGMNRLSIRDLKQNLYLSILHLIKKI